MNPMERIVALKPDLVVTGAAVMRTPGKPTDVIRYWVVMWVDAVTIERIADTLRQRWPHGPQPERLSRQRGHC